MRSADIRKKFLDFYAARGHAVIPSASLVPENDPTTLFTSSGMQPLVPYLLGQPHPAGKRLVNSQKSFRAQDIDEVGDNRHTTFFEMLGNWSLGDYFKKEQLQWILKFLTEELGLSKERLYVAVFAGTKDVPKDEESEAIWKGLGIPDARIFFYDISKNWWSRSGEPENMPAGEPGGPDSEIFFDFGKERQIHENSPFKKEPCHPNCGCGRFMEIANSVFMQYVKKKDGTLVELPNKNVDFGGGLERMTAATGDDPDVFHTDLFSLIIRTIELLSKRTYGEGIEETRAMRVIADHIRAAAMMLADGVAPSNKTQGYVLRRLIRRSILYGRTLGFTKRTDFISQLVAPVAEVYAGVYLEVVVQQGEIELILAEEARRFSQTVDRGLREIEKVKELDGKLAFRLYESYGFPWELTVEIAKGRGQEIDYALFEEQFKKHQDLSRTAAAGIFAGGLADHGEETVKLHTATHLLHAALRQVLGTHVTQRGSHITAERLRFDFSHPTKPTKEELEGIEELVNQKIQKNLPVFFALMDKDEAIAMGALAFFGERYGEKVKVYSIGTFSKEICGGPHVSFTGTLGHFTIIKEEALGAGVRRIYAQLT